MTLPITEYYDNKLLTQGIDSFNNNELNSFISQIATVKNLSVMAINSAYLLQYHIDLKIKKLNAECEKEILSGFVSQTTGHTYRTNIDDQINFLGKYQVVKDDPTITEVFWKAEDVGEQIPHTRDEFLAVHREGFDHKEGALSKIHTLRKQVRAATTDSELLLIQW